MYTNVNKYLLALTPVVGVCRFHARATKAKFWGRWEEEKPPWVLNPLGAVSLPGRAPPLTAALRTRLPPGLSQGRRGFPEAVGSALATLARSTGISLGNSREKSHFLPPEELKRRRWLLSAQTHPQLMWVLLRVSACKYYR